MRTLTFKCTTKTVGKILDKLAIVFEVMAFKEAFCSPFLFVNISSKSDLSKLDSPNSAMGQNSSPL